MSTIKAKIIEAISPIFCPIWCGFLGKKTTYRSSYQKTSSRFSVHIIEDRRSKLLWPQNNGEVERKNRSLLEFQQVAHEEKNNWPSELISWLTVL